MIAMDALWTFSLMVGLLTVTPGLDTALVLRTAVAPGAWSSASRAARWSGECSPRSV
ncbi:MULTISPECIES: hypothetical protein [Streptomyces]|uniref:hypothetical protein n=1 Tax=Streptomyces TaxID=1883 RepID=UPI000A4AF455|nr:hypothetical protein [Streptomyces avermitilis]